MSLSLCSGCARHVRAASDSCPFCGASIEIARRERTVRVSRAVLVATTVALTTAGCPMNGYGGPPPNEVQNTTTASDAGTD